MSTLSFPSTPSLNDTYTFGGKTWVWNGSYWALQSTGAINGIPIGNVTPSTGAFTTLASSGNTTLGDIAGDLVPAANLTYSLGNATHQWANIYVGGNTIFLGDLQLKDLGSNTLAVYTADGTTPAAVAATVTASDITGTVANANYAITANVADSANLVAGANISGTVANATYATTANLSNFATTAFAVAGANVSGTVAQAEYVTQAAQANITSVGTLTALDVTGNITAGNLSGTVVAGTLTTAAQPNITSVGTLTALSVLGNVIANSIIGNTASISGNLNMNNNSITNVADPVDATDAANKQYVDEVAEGLKAKPAVEIATTGNLIANYNNGNAGVGATLTSTTNGAFPEIDGVTLTSTTPGQNGVLVKNQTNAAYNGRYNLTQVGDGSNPWILTRCGLCDQADEIPGAYVFVKRGTTLAGTGWVAVVADPNTFVVGTDAINWFQFSGAGTYSAGTGLALDETTFYIANTSVTAGSYGSGDAIATFTVNAQGQLTSAANTAVTANAANLTGTTLNSSVVNSSLTSVGTLSSLTVTGNISGNYFVGNGSLLTGITTSGGGISFTSQANTAPTSPNNGDFWYDTFADVKYQYINDGTSSQWIDQSFPTSFSSISVGNITNSNANGVGNIGSSSTYFNTIFARATSAQYADLAEFYDSDQPYVPGTVVVFGGDREITISNHSHDTAVAGVISTDPAFVMNTAQTGQHMLPVALTGRVPCLVQGPVAKGDVLVTGTQPGTAQRIQDSWQPGCVIGKSIEEINNEEVKMIQVVVGRF